MMTAEQRDSLLPADYDGLAKLRADILVTHEAPSSHRPGFAPRSTNSLAR